MRVLFSLLLVALLPACATNTGGGDGGEDQVAAATAAWRAAYDSRDPTRITAMYDSDAVLQARHVPRMFHCQRVRWTFDGGGVCSIAACRLSEIACYRKDMRRAVGDTLLGREV
jgi:ketosteroid isomerase-like protein